jgi:hypothetical protein
MHDDLRNLLIAWMVSRTDEGSGFYVSGVARIAAMLLINMSTNEQAFVALRNYLERGCPRALYGGEGSREDVGRTTDISSNSLTQISSSRHILGGILAKS